MAGWRDTGTEDGTDVQGLIKALAETWIDPGAAAEAIAIEQEAMERQRVAAAGAEAATPMRPRLRPPLRVVVGSRE
jgi:hypothetical protein